MAPADSIVRVTSDSPDQTRQLGLRLGRLLGAGDVVCLSGNLGAGKTVFTRGIGEGWGAREHVTSPTFTLIHEHRRSADSLVLYHVDSYRLAGMADAWGIGLEDLFHGEAVLVVEWPENIRDALPADLLWITFSIVDDTRRDLVFQAAGEHYRQILAAFQARLPGG